MPMFVASLDSKNHLYNLYTTTGLLSQVWFLSVTGLATITTLGPAHKEVVNRMLK